MSVEKVNAFFEKMEEDKELREKLKALAEREGAQDADLVQMACSAGFEFTAEDLQKARAAEPGRLSDKELGAVAGGEWRCTTSLARRWCVGKTRIS